MSDDDVTVLLASIVSALGGLADAIRLVEAKGDMRPDIRRQRLRESLERVDKELLEATIGIMELCRESHSEPQ